MILARGNLSDDTLAALRARWEIDRSAPDRMAPEAAARVQVIATWGGTRTDAAIFDRFPALGLVCALGSGHEGIDVRAAAERGIAVTHGRASNASAVADLAMALLLASVRQVVPGDAFVRSGRWAAGDEIAPALVRGLTGRKVGIYGLGEIGDKVARRAAAFEMEVGYHGRTPRPDAPYRYHPTLLGLAEWADILVVAVRAGPETHGRVDRRVLAALGPEGHLVNVARGSVVDEAALVGLLAEDAIAGAGLDVFADEPNVPEGLIRSGRTVLMPHLGAATIDAQARMDELLVANIEAFLAGRPLLTPVPGSIAPGATSEAAD